MAINCLIGQCVFCQIDNEHVAGRYVGTTLNCFKMCVDDRIVELSANLIHLNDPTQVIILKFEVDHVFVFFVFFEIRNLEEGQTIQIERNDCFLRGMITDNGHERNQIVMVDKTNKWVVNPMTEKISVITTRHKNKFSYACLKKLSNTSVKILSQETTNLTCTVDWNNMHQGKVFLFQTQASDKTYEWGIMLQVNIDVVHAIWNCQFFSIAGNFFSLLVVNTKTVLVNV